VLLHLVGLGVADQGDQVTSPYSQQGKDAEVTARQSHTMSLGRPPAEPRGGPQANSVASHRNRYSISPVAPPHPRFEQAARRPRSYPADVFERFTDRARKIVVFAQQEARLLNHDYIGTEHLLLGLIREGEGVAAKALESMGISLEAVRAEVVGAVGEGGGTPPGHIPFTARAKKVLELSLREALQLGHDYIGTEHILLGLIREGQGVAAQVLEKLGADLDGVRESVNQLLSGMGITASSEGAPPEEFPICPSCSAPLAATLKIRTIDVPEGEEIAHVRVAHCGRCGLALGIA